jgi:hypothetical protein
MKPKKGHCCVYCSYGTVPCSTVSPDRDLDAGTGLDGCLHVSPIHDDAHERIAVILVRFSSPWLAYSAGWLPLLGSHGWEMLGGATAVPLANVIGLASAGNMGDAVVRCGAFAN